MTENCGLCRFFLPDTDKPTEGICRRYPPETHILTDVQVVPGKSGPTPQTTQRQGAFFPSMAAETGWCGEYAIRRDVH
jgi:hypothetical protein